MSTLTPIRLTPLIATARQMGAQFTEQNGWRIPVIFSDALQEISAARARVALVDETPRGKLYVEGCEAESVLQNVAIPPYNVFRLRKDLYFISTTPNEEPNVSEILQAVVRASGKFVTVTDMTCGLAEIRLVGPASRALLSKLGGLDFDERSFPNHAAKQSSIAKTKQLIIRRDVGKLPAFSIIGARSLAAYLWAAILRAGHEWDILPMGQVAMKRLEEKS